MAEIELDDLDISLLQACQETPGKAKSEICSDFVEELGTRALYYRMDRLDQAGLIRVEKSAVRGRALCYIEESGKEALGRKNIPPKAEESS